MNKIALALAITALSVLLPAFAQNRDPSPRVHVPDGSPANNDCTKWILTGSLWTLGTAGAACGSGGSGITTLNTLTGATQTFTNDTNVTIVSGGTAHVITWAGTLADARVANDITLTNLTQVTTRSHTDLSSIGTNTHAQIDTHLAATAAHGATGAVVGTTNTQLLTNKSLQDSTTTIEDNGDPTKKVTFMAGNITTGTTRTFTFPDANSVGVVSSAAVANQFLTDITTLGVTTRAQPSFANLSGAATDAQIPNTITVDLATVATTANAGDSATAFFSAGTIETARLGSGTANSTTFLRGDQTWATVSGTGDFVGPASSTDNAFVRFDGTTGKLGQNSTAATLDDSGNAAFNSLSTGGSANACDGTAGCVQLGQGTTPTAQGTTAIQIIAPAAVTSYRIVLPGAAATGIRHLTNSANVVTETISAINLASADVTGVLATANIATALANQVSIRGLGITASTGTLTIANGKTLTYNNSITMAGTDATTMTFPTTSASIARTDAANTFTGVQTMTGAALTTPAITGLATGSGVASAATASTLAARDANANLSANSWIDGYTTTATAAGTTTLTVGSTRLQYFTGTTTQTVTLPVTSTMVLGQQFYLVNNSTGAVTVNSSGSNVVLVLAGGTRGFVTVILTSGTTAASWSNTYWSQSQTKVVTAVDFATNTTVANGLFYLLVGEDLTGMNLAGISAQVYTAGTTNTTNVQVTRCRAAATGNACTGTTNSMLSTVATIDSAENSTATAAAAAVIDAANDDVVTGDILRIDITQISTTPAKGLTVKLRFANP